MKKFLIAVLFILGFPALIGLVVWNNIDIITGGISYGIFVFVGIILVVAMFLIYLITVLVNVKSKKKSKYSQTIAMCLVSFLCLGGLWIVIDVALPEFLSDATSGTIFYEDLAENYKARAEVNESLLNEYIARNYEVGNLPKTKSLKKYQEEGYNNELVRDLLAYHFASIDKDGYATFNGPWIDLAMADRMTIPTIVHLLLNEREVSGEPFPYYDESSKSIMEGDAVYWHVLDMLGEAMEMDLGTALDDLNVKLTDSITLDKGMIDVLVPLISETLGDTLVEGVLGSPIYVEINGSVVSLNPSNASRGVLDYMSMAWLNSNGLIYAIVTLFSCRTLFLIFAGWMVLNNFLIGLLRGMTKEERDKQGKGTAPLAYGRPNSPTQGLRYGYVTPPYQSFEYDPYHYSDMRRDIIDRTRGRLS